MRSRVSNFVFRNMLLAAFSSLLASTFFAPLTAHCQPRNLFLPDSQQNRVAAESRMPPQALRARSVRIDQAVLDLPELVLNLFDDAAYTVIRQSRIARGEDFYSWSGSVKGDPLGRALLVYRQGRITGSVHAKGRLFEIRPLKQGGQAIYEIDQSAFPPEGCPEPDPLRDIYPPAPPSSQVTPLAPDFPNDGGAVIDVMVAYTTLAKNADTDILSTIQLAIDDTNASYSHSNIVPRVNLVYTVETTYTDSGNLLTDVNRLQNTSDGYMDNLHTLRNTCQADLVVLLVENGGAYCGYAYTIMATATGAFCVVDRGCAVSNHSFAHEMGHLQGARHDRYVDSNSTPYVYGHGYINHPDRWRTVMSYNNECDDSGYYCTRLQYWSNPDIAYGGDPMGTATYEDNSRVLDNTASTVAVFRNSLTTLSNRTPVTSNDLPRDYRFAVYNNDWCGIAIAPTTDHDIACDDVQGCPSPYQDSAYGGTTRDFVVVNGHHLGASAYHYAEVHYGTFSNYTIEADNSPWDLTLGAAHDSSFSVNNVIVMFEVNITQNGQYRLWVDNKSPYLDLAVFLYEPDTANAKRSLYYKRASGLGAGNDAGIFFTAAVAGEYGIAVINENGGFGDFSILVKPAGGPVTNQLLLR